MEDMLIEMLPLILFVLVSVAIWAGLSFFSSAVSKQDKRLSKVAHQGLEETEESAPKQSRDYLEGFVTAAKAMASPMMPKSEGEQSEIRKELSYAGFRSETALATFQGFRFITLLVFMVPALLYNLNKYGMNYSALQYIIVFSAIGMYIPKVGLWYVKSKRQEEIFLTLPDIIDLLVVCVESGLGLDAAMRRVCEEMKDHAKVMSQELANSNFQLQIGKARKDVLRDLGERNGVEDLRSLTTIIIQADRFGASIANALRVQSDSMRTKRKQMAEEKASKCAVQLLFPMLLFIFPGVFVILVGPAAIKMMMSGQF